MKRLLSLLLIVFTASAFAADPLTFYDWQVHFQSKERQPITCVIQLTGVNRERRVLLDVNFSVIIQKVPLTGTKATTILRIKANRINKSDLSDLSPIKINDAWIETALGTSAGQLAKVDVSPEPHYLGGKEGSELFHQLFGGILKNGATIGYQEGEKEVISSVPTPPPDVIINKLMPCLAAILPDADQPA